MAGVYVHIPFCRQLCGYCDFHFSVSLQRKEEMLQALLRELGARRDYLAGERVETLYFGGGTPTVYSPGELQRIANRVKELFAVEKFREATVEANPDDLTGDYLKALAETDVDRLSIGVQSFVDEHLKFFNRRHDARAAAAAVKAAKAHGFGNITIDLIYGVPGMTSAQWEYNLKTFLELDIPHLSAYHLTIEPQTIFGKRAVRPVDDRVSEAHYAILEKVMDEAGYLHYEVSNFARPGFEGLHNGNYWNGVHYLGTGPSAHSYDGKSRCWNVRSNNAYLRGEAGGTETLDERDKWNEYLITRLRTSQGIDPAHAREIFGRERVERLVDAAGSLNIVTNNGKLRISSENFLTSDSIILKLIEN